MRYTQANAIVIYTKDACNFTCVYLFEFIHMHTPVISAIWTCSAEEEEEGKNIIYNIGKIFYFMQIVFEHRASNIPSLTPKAMPVVCLGGWLEGRQKQSVIHAACKCACACSLFWCLCSNSFRECIKCMLRIKNINFLAFNSEVSEFT